jgi:hypothetical protein
MAKSVNALSGGRSSSEASEMLDDGSVIPGVFFISTLKSLNNLPKTTLFHVAFVARKNQVISTSTTCFKLADATCLAT